MMKILKITERDVDIYGDYLKEPVARKFIDGGYTHVKCGRDIMDTEATGDLVCVGQQVYEDFSLFGMYRACLSDWLFTWAFETLPNKCPEKEILGRLHQEYFKKVLELRRDDDMRIRK